MHARNVWLGNTSWPTNRSLGEFANDCFRLSGAKTDREKALAFYDWMIRCLRRGGPNPVANNGCGGYSRCFDCLTNFASWGDGECTFWGWIATEALCAAGLKARRVVAHKSGHTFYEVWYKGLNGREQWHAFDPFGGWYFLNERGEVASCAELAANPRLVQNPLPGHATPIGHHPDRANQAHRHRLEDQLFIEQPIQNETLSWDLRRGQQVTHLWMPEAPDKALFTWHPQYGETPPKPELLDGHPSGMHDDIPEITRLGELAYPQHEPYWRNYRWPTPGVCHRNEGRPVRWHGSGALRWKPLLQGADAACYAIQARFEDGKLRPSEQHAFTEVWYHFRLPYLVSYLMLDYDIVGAGDDYCGFSISADNRRTIWPLATRSYAPHWGLLVNGQAEWKQGKPSVQGLREFWLRIDMYSHHANPTLALQGLNITVGFQHNMDVQPRLVPGDNNLWLSAAEMDAGSELQAEWIYQLNRNQAREALILNKAGRVEKQLNIAAACPSDILMTGLRLSLK